MTRFYDDTASPFVRAYDAFYSHAPSQIAGDVDVYLRGGLTEPASVQATRTASSSQEASC